MIGSILDHLSPYSRVITATLPFAIATLARFIYGKNRTTKVLLSIGTMWFFVNVILAPYSGGMQQDMAHVRAWFH